MQNTTFSASDCKQVKYKPRPIVIIRLTHLNYIEARAELGNKVVFGYFFGWVGSGG